MLSNSNVFRRYGRYRKPLDTVEAVRVLASNYAAILAEMDIVASPMIEGQSIHVESADGSRVAYLGDWLVRQSGVLGHECEVLTDWEFRILYVPTDDWPSQ